MTWQRLENIELVEHEYDIDFLARVIREILQEEQCSNIPKLSRMRRRLKEWRIAAVIIEPLW